MSFAKIMFPRKNSLYLIDKRLGKYQIYNFLQIYQSASGFVNVKYTDKNYIDKFAFSL